MSWHFHRPAPRSCSLRHRREEDFRLSKEARKEKRDVSLTFSISARAAASTVIRVEPGKANHPGTDAPALEVRVIEDPHQPPVDANAEMALLDNHFMAGMTGGHFRKRHPKTESHGVASDSSRSISLRIWPSTAPALGRCCGCPEAVAGFRSGPLT